MEHVPFGKNCTHSENFEYHNTKYIHRAFKPGCNVVIRTHSDDYFGISSLNFFVKITKKKNFLFGFPTLASAFNLALHLESINNH